MTSTDAGPRATKRAHVLLGIALFVTAPLATAIIEGLL